jgi:hypothetical protein
MSDGARCKCEIANKACNVSTSAVHIYCVDSERFLFPFSRTSFPRAFAAQCCFTHGYDDPCQITPRLGFSTMLIGLVLERRKLFLCIGQKESSNPITSYLTGYKMDGIRDPTTLPPGNSSSYFCCLFILPFSFLFSLTHNLYGIGT